MQDFPQEISVYELGNYIIPRRRQDPLIFGFKMTTGVGSLVPTPVGPLGGFVVLSLTKDSMPETGHKAIPQSRILKLKASGGFDIEVSICQRDGEILCGRIQSENSASPQVR